MTATEVREIVNITIEELIRRNLIMADTYQIALKTVESRLYKYFKDNNDAGIAKALNNISGDSYIDIIFLKYRDGKSQERISDILSKDITTIKRNKKRLILEIYELLEKKDTF